MILPHRIKELQQRLFKQFITFLKRQDKITKISDMVPDLRYVWVHSPDGFHPGRVTLWEGNLLEKTLGGEEGDAQINVELGVENEYLTRVWYHKKGTPFFTNWKEEE